ncbi:Protein FAR-RED IMPAIRED RESPONSE 1 [Bienertia sinuspersici]
MTMLLVTLTELLATMTIYKVTMTGLYQEREWWIPPYMKDMFWAGVRSTQRVESMNSIFDKYLKKQTRLYEFVQQ